MPPIHGRLVAVTGGARGIGAATAAELRERGARVVTGDLDGADTHLDVTDRASWESFLAAAGPIDVLVNNAGVMHVGPFLEETDTWTRRQFEVNVLGVIVGMKLALPAMLARGSGHIVNVASMAAHVISPGESVYGATKHAVLGLTQSVRQEHRGSGVDFSLVMPGLVATDLAAGTLKGSKVSQPHDVARAIAGAIERPRFDVYVPASLGPTVRAIAWLPRGPREALMRLAGAGRNTRGTTAAERAAYESRYDRD